MLVAVVSAKGAPGVTATSVALALTWRRAVVLAECDPRGGDVLAGFGAARVPAGPGLLKLHVVGRHGGLGTVFWEQVLRLGDPSQARFVLPGLDSAQQAGAVDWVALATVFQGLHSEGVDVIADCGEIHAQHTPRAVYRDADLVVLVVRATLPAIRVAMQTVQALRDELRHYGMGAHRLVAVVVETKHGYNVSEARQEFERCQVPVVGSLPWNERAARTLTEGADSLRSRRSSLMRAADSLGYTLGCRAHGHRLEVDAPHGRAQPAVVAESVGDHRIVAVQGKARHG